MTLTVDLPPELAEALSSLAQRTGQKLDQVVAQLLQAQVRQQGECFHPASVCSTEETRLLQELQEGLPESTWRRYHELVARRESETLPDDEQPELVALADTVEGWNVRRLELARDLAELRGVPWQTIVEELDLVRSKTGA